MNMYTISQEKPTVGINADIGLVFADCDLRCLCYLEIDQRMIRELVCDVKELALINRFMALSRVVFAYIELQIETFKVKLPK